MTSPTTHSCPQCGSGLVQGTHPQSRDYLRHRLSELNSLIAALNAERDALQAESDAIVYPVLSLPPEAMAEIFEHCVASKTIPSPSSAPLLLTQVCRQWRQIAFATPRLWKSLTFQGRVREEVINMWLSRSGNVPLDHNVETRDPSTLGVLLDASLQHAHRWEEMAFVIPFSSMRRLNFGDVLLPLLRKISVDSDYSYKGNIVSHPIVIRNAPALREAHIGTIPRRKFHLPWCQLETLTLRTISLIECLSILEQCSELRNLVLFRASFMSGS
ncbi:hypothetical protein FB45DRAFT_743632 [Roridomyces roridus]|uniref:F-box domain-containing protein n=1 Tax=Roridomyces roridus TaxID=1738132 RepID=A0AAD7C098_9AGAR|nr:hypothetical protein FB45DRAFT_743632 [Roridomyces roridus]